MTQKDKELLIKDLCARLPYRVKYMDLWNPDELPTTLCDINVDVELIMNTDGFSLEVEKCKPYLFPLSSMTEEERITIGNQFAYGQPHKSIDILHQKHIDYRGLISMGLAIDATGLNIY